MVEVDSIVKDAQKRGAQEAEVISETSMFKYVKVTPGGQNQAVLGENARYALRAVVDGAVGFAYFTGNVEDAVKGAISLAKGKEKSERWRFFISDRPAHHLNLYRKSVEDIPIEQVITDLEVTCEATEDEKITASNAGCQLVCSTVEIANTSGVHRQESRSFTSLWVNCRAADADYGMGYSYKYSLQYDFDFLGIGNQVKHHALHQLGKQKTEPGKKMVILAPRVFSNLLVSAALPSFLGNNVVRQRSALHLGRKVASDHLAIKENPLVESPQGRSFDDEGVPSTTVTLVDNARVQNFLYDTYCGETTASGIRYAQYHGRSLRYVPRPCATSLSVTGESASLDTLISEIKDGLLILDETNAHASQQQTGLFSIAVTGGFIIKNGEISAPVKRCMVSGLAFEDLLPNVVQLSNKRELHRSFVYPTYVETGHVLVDSLRITA